MAVHSPNRQRSFNRPRPPTQQVATAPAPVRGLDGRQPLYNQNGMNYVLGANMVPSEYGLRTRRGYREYAVNIPNTDGVKTIIPFDSEDAAVTSKLFAVTNNGFYDVSTEVDTPVVDLAFGSTIGNAGYGIHTNFTTDAGDQYVLYADGENGYYNFDGATWAAGSVTGPTAGNIVFVATHKQRVWVIEKNSSKAWYLAPGAISGPATEFNFGSLFSTGGDLVGLWNWTLDGGDGVDDYLVAVSRGGDVVVFQGEDPSSASSWFNRGVYQIGTIPAGNRIATDYGGDLHLLSRFGAVAMSDLLRGTPWLEEQRGIAYAIARLVRNQMDNTVSQLGWEFFVFDSEGQLIINFPQGSNANKQQFVYNTTTKGWGIWRNLPMQTGSTWLGDMYMGGEDGTVYIYENSVDNVLFDGTPGTPVRWDFLTAFTDLGAPGVQKCLKHCRPYFLSGQEAAIEASARYDYDLSDLGITSTSLTITGDVWDNGIWDSALWSSGGEIPFKSVIGLSGVGVNVALAFRGEAVDRMTLTNWDVTWTVGGFL